MIIMIVNYYNYIILVTYIALIFTIFFHKNNGLIYSTFIIYHNPWTRVKLKDELNNLNYYIKDLE